MGELEHGEMEDFEKCHEPNNCKRCVEHSGDLMRETEGQHTMKVELDNLPATITDLFFVLAAWNCDDISLFPSPSVRLFDGDRPGNQLTEYNIEKAGHSQAVVMCALSRSKGPWIMQAFGATCGGNCKYYAPI